jgi:mannosyltransferase
MTSPSGSPTGQAAGGDAAVPANGSVANGGVAHGAAANGAAANGAVAVGSVSAGIVGEGTARPGSAQAELTGSGDGERGGRHDRGPVWALVLPPLVGLGLSLWDISRPSFWRDEAATIAADRRPFGALIRMLGHVDVVHGAYYSMMWPLVHLFGPTAFVMRFPSALAAGVTAAFVAAIGRRVISPWVGLAAGLLYAVLPVASRYGQEARSYEMVVGTACIASYLLIRVFQASEESRRKWLIGYGVSIAVLGILNIFGLLLIPAHLITVALAYRHRRGSAEFRRLAIGWLLAVVAAVVVCSPLLWEGYEQRGQVAWIANNQSSSGLGTLITLAGSTLVTVVVAGVIALALILSLEAAGASAARRGAWRWQLTELSVPWMLAPPVLLLGVSIVDPIYTSRYVLMCIPAGALLGGMAIVALGRIAGPVALVLVLLAGLTIQVTQREPYGHYDNVRALDQIVAAHAKPGDVVLYTNPNAESFGAAYTYGLGTLPNIATKQAAIPSGTLAGTSVGMATLRARLSHASRVWVVEINHCLSEPQVLSLSGVQQGAPLTGLPLRFTRIWHERGDWLFLYTHGHGNQALTTACQGHT